MTFSKMTKLVSLVLLMTLIIVSCTLTTTKTKAPLFSKSTDSLQADLNKIVSCEGINIDGEEITTNGKVSSELEIDITNGHNIPADENQMDDLGKQIAVIVKQSLKDKGEYNTYKVLFVIKKEDGSVTETTSKGKIFKSEEL